MVSKKFRTRKIEIKTKTNMQWVVQKIINKFKKSLRSQLRGLNVEERNHGRLRYAVSSWGGLLIESKFYQTAVNEQIIPFFEALKWRNELAITLV